jgi:hypothetical protein
MFDMNEQFVVDLFLKRFDTTLLKIDETPQNKSPDVKFTVQDYTILGEIKTLSDTFKEKIANLGIETVPEGLVFEESREDKTWSKVARAIRKATFQFENYISDYKAIILLNDENALISDLDDCLRGFTLIGEYPSALPYGARIEREKWKFLPDLIFWIDAKSQMIDVRSGNVPNQLQAFFGERLNA